MCGLCVMVCGTLRKFDKRLLQIGFGLSSLGDYMCGDMFGAIIA